MDALGFEPLEMGKRLGHCSSVRQYMSHIGVVIPRRKSGLLCLAQAGLRV